MSTYYIKGGSKFNEVNPNVWLGLHLAGYPSGDYLDADWKDFNTSGADEDPYWRLGGDGGQNEVEIGLSGDYRIKVDSAGIWGWHEASGTWFTLFGSGVYGVFDDHGSLNGLGDDDHTQYHNDARAVTWISGDTLYTRFYAVSGDYISLSGGYIVTSGDFITHSGLSSAHHTKYTDADARASIGDIFGSDGHADTNIDMDFNKIVDLGDPTADYHAVHRKYVNDLWSGFAVDDHTHQMTGLSAGSWKMFYSNVGGNVLELGMGGAGEVLQSQGGAAPVWAEDVIGAQKLADLTDVDEELSGAIISLNVNGDTFDSGLVDGQLVFDTGSESWYRWQSHIGAFVEIGGGGNGGYSGLEWPVGAIWTGEWHITGTQSNNDVIFWGSGGYATQLSLGTSGLILVSLGTGLTWESREDPDFSGDFVVLSGDYVASSGDLSDYKVLSGDYVASSGDLSDYKVLSGDYSSSSGDLADYKIVSGDYVITSGDYSTTSGAVSDYATVSGDFIVVSGDYVTTSGAEANAIHDNVDGEINAIADKASPAGADLVIIEDSAASYAKKKVSITNLAGGADKTRTIKMEMVEEGASTRIDYGILCDVAPEGVTFSVKLPDNIDASQNIKVTWTWRCQLTHGASKYNKRWVGANKTDGTEAITWNIQSNASYGLAPQTATYIYTSSYTINAANIEVGDHILVLLRCFSSGVQFLMLNAYLTYEVV